MEGERLTDNLVSDAKRDHRNMSLRQVQPVKTKRLGTRRSRDESLNDKHVWPPRFWPRFISTSTAVHKSVVAQKRLEFRKPQSHDQSVPTFRTRRL